MYIYCGPAEVAEKSLPTVAVHW